ncbi:hypothetical protein DICVIV_13681 [Dictyocaulus viviparus]|uniref:Uncharacterized protein n=1 Tax=Dictyocaulus viviparus TaxID=29172 RepID=A0A0D8X775_DICVI|nr:hypothetical protein DICVIV_13681 [Dictyocaulus viviparus]
MLERSDQRDPVKQKKAKSSSSENSESKRQRDSTEKLQSKNLKSRPLYEKGVVELTAKVKGRKPPKNKKRLLYLGQRDSTEKLQSKNLKSRPLYEKGVVELTAKVKGRKPPKNKKRLGSRSDDVISYPSNLKKNRRKEGAETSEEAGQTTILTYDTCAEISELKSVSEKVLPYSGMPLLTNNKCNDNNLFVNNMPFWWSPEMLDITDDDLVMNATVIVDFLEKRLKLVPMPDIQIILDPIEDVTVLQARNDQCFTKSMVFANTVRTMVNLNELSIRTLQGTSKRQRKKKRTPENDQIHSLDIEEPTSRTIYQVM